MSKDSKELEERLAAAAKAERDKLQREFKDAKISGSMLDLDALKTRINQSSMSQSDKDAFNASVSRVLIELELAQEKIISGLKANDQQVIRELLKITEEEEKKRQEYVKQIYSEFDGFQEAFLKKQEAKIELFDTVLEDMKSGKEPSAKTIEALGQLIKDIEADRELLRKVQEVDRVSLEELKRLEAEREKIKLVKKAIQEAIRNSKGKVPKALLNEEKLLKKLFIKNTADLKETKAKRDAVVKHIEVQDRLEAKFKETLAFSRTPGVSEEYKKRLTNLEEILNEPQKVLANQLSEKPIREIQPPQVESVGEHQISVGTHKAIELNHKPTKSLIETNVLPPVESLKNIKPQFIVTRGMNVAKDLIITGVKQLWSTVKDVLPKFTDIKAVLKISTKNDLHNTKLANIPEKELRKLEQEASQVEYDKIKRNKLQKSSKELQPPTGGNKKNNKDIGRY